MIIKVLRALLPVIFCFTLPAILFAQQIDPDDIVTAPAPPSERICTFEPTDINARHFVGHRDVAGKSASNVQTSEFEVSYVNNCGANNWPEEAIEAFEFAMQIWETHLQSTVPVRVQATWADGFDRRVLANAGPTLIAQVPSPIGTNNTWYSVAQASAMTGVDIVATNTNTEFDIVTNINCERNDWYFGTDAETPPDFIDFVTVILHEIGHGIGFIGSLRADPDITMAEWGFASNTGQTFPIIYDRFAEDGDGISVLNENVYPNPSSDLYFAGTGQNDGILFNGIDANQVFAGTPIPLFAPFPWQPGSSYSHLDLDTFSNTENGLMRPRIDMETAIHTPGPVFCGMLSDMGWPLGANCQDLIGVESAIVVEQTLVEFGVSNRGSVVERVFTVSNNISANDPLSGRMLIEDENFQISSADEIFSIEPGESRDINVRYNPRSANIHNAEMILFHNSGDQPNPLRIQLNAEALEQNETFVLDQNFSLKHRSNML